MRFVTYYLAASCLLFAQTAQRMPSLNWEGEIRGGATLFVQGKRLDMEGRGTNAIDRPKFRFAEPLTAAHKCVDLKVRSGTGEVEIVEQPSADNDRTVVVDIRNKEKNPDFYRIEFFWSKEACAPPPVKSEIEAGKSSSVPPPQQRR
jgi:hypothetical protein